MLIKYLEHALRRMNQRRISKIEVEQAIRNADLSLSGRLGRYISIKKYDDKLLKVVYEKENNKITVVTVYWTRRLR